MGKHSPGKLHAVALKRLSDGWHSDGGNLYLFVRGKSRTWVFRYTAPDGTRRNMGLGGLDAIPLARARELAGLYRQQVKDKQSPVDPIEAVRSERAKRRAEVAKRMTFKQCAERFIEIKRAEWKNAKHAAQWTATLETYAFPVFGDLPVEQVDDALVMAVLAPIWLPKTETATRVRGRIESVLDWATASKFRRGENPARWRGHLDKLLPKPSKVARVEHHAALPYQEIGTFMQELRKREGFGARALEFAILTAARSGEVRGATWDEVNLRDKVWTVPADRMKAAKEHRVPLSDAAVSLLGSLPRLDGCNLIFPSATGKMLSDMVMTATLKRMGRTDLTAHGFRSTFRDWAGELSTFPREVIENALAHQLKDKAEAAYSRGTQFEKRRRLMTAWAEYCDRVGATADNVTAIRSA